MPDVLGVAAFGLGDSCVGEKSVRTRDFRLSAVILPRSWRGAFLTGDTAKESRLETGLGWPPEAAISDATVLRRVPVGLLWSRLVQDGDKTSYWAPSTGTARFSTAAALHAHLADLLERADWQEQDVVVAIPDTLDEMGQEDLLRSFGERRERVQLVWRPVAAAMQWLHALGPDFRIDPGDWMLVVYLGPDIFEVTTFALQHDAETGYPVPVRSRGRKGAGLTGLDWAWSCCPGTSAGEIWQQVLRFPEVWEAITRQDGARGIPRIRSRSDGSWDIWEPERDLLSWQNVRACGSAWLSFQLNRKDDSDFSSWDDFFRSMIHDAMDRGGNRGRLRGVVMCGPLVPHERPGWFDAFSHAGAMRISRVPAPDTVWLPLWADGDIVAKGAQLYGKRLRSNLPTYLDTLPELKILTQNRRKHLVWTSLVAAATCKGGQEYTNVVHGFNYQKYHSSLNVLLEKENEHNYRSEEVPLPFIPVQDIPIEIRVRMKPASGLAQVRLVALDNSVEELLFDFSRMEEISELPKETLFCPDDGHIPLADAVQSQDQKAFISDCRNFVQASPSFLRKSYDKLRTKWLLPSQQLKIIDENGKTQSQFEDTLNQVVKRLVEIRGQAGIQFPKLVKQASFLWGRTPRSFRDDIADKLRKPRLIDKEFIEAAGRCFQAEEECRLLFRYIVKFHLKYAYALMATFSVLHYRSEAWGALEEKTAYGLLEMALDMMEEQRAHKKVKFRNAASLLFVLLKYRLQSDHMDFLGKNDKRANRLFSVREKLQNYVDELDGELNDLSCRNLPARTRKNLETSRRYIYDILQYIDYKGDPSAVPIAE